MMGKCLHDFDRELQGWRECPRSRRDADLERRAAKIIPDLNEV